MIYICIWNNLIYLYNTSLLELIIPVTWYILYTAYLNLPILLATPYTLGYCNMYIGFLDQLAVISY